MAQVTERKSLSVKLLSFFTTFKYKVVDYQCSYCVGFKKKALCRKLPDCSDTSGTFYFRKLNAFEVRKAKKAKKIIQEI